MKAKKVETVKETLKRVEEIQKKNEAFLPLLLPNTPVLVRGIIEGIELLDEESQNKVFRHLGAVCSRLTREQRIEKGAPVPTSPMPLDEMPERIKKIALSDMQREWNSTKDGNTIIVNDGLCKTFGCCCRLVLAGYIDPSENMCKKCQAGYYEEYMTHMSGQKPIKIETTGFTCGSEFCTGKATFAPTKK